MIVISNMHEQYKTFIRRVVTYFKSVPTRNFLVCGDLADIDLYDSIIEDTRNQDLDRQAERKDK